jgi:hypothetical protein
MHRGGSEGKRVRDRVGAPLDTLHMGCSWVVTQSIRIWKRERRLPPLSGPRQSGCSIVVQPMGLQPDAVRFWPLTKEFYTVWISISCNQPIMRDPDESLIVKSG